MGKKYHEITPEHMGFIASQKLYFCATAAPEGRVNVSPKGGDTLRVTGANQVVWLNLTGSGNETAAHLMESSRMTLMFCAFEGKPKILRLYGNARTILPDDDEWPELYGLFDPQVGARQILVLEVDLVQTSCGFGVPYFDYAGDRADLKRWGEERGEQGVREYWRLKNTRSLDGQEIPIPSDNESENARVSDDSSSAEPRG